MKIGLFGGSFNPIHKGHIKIAKEAIKALKLDKVIFIPCQKNPFKKDLNYVDGKMRVEMINLVLEDKMEISTFEIDRKGISYTIDTVKYFKNKFKNDDLFFILGSDNLTKLPKWKDIDEIAKYVKLAVFKRKQTINKTNIKKYNAILINNKIYPESSSDYLKGELKMLDDKVLSYIGKHRLYFDQLLKNILDQKRYLHSIHARDFAIQVAKKHNYDVEKAGFAAFVHDIAKHIANDDKDNARKIIKKYEPEKVKIEDYKLHQEVGYIILKHIFNIDDDICHAIRVHTSLDIELNTLDKIVYLADKLCQGRKYKDIQKDRELALKNIDLALKNVIKKTIEFNELKGITFTEEQNKIYRKWLKND